MFTIIDFDVFHQNLVVYATHIHPLHSQRQIIRTIVFY